MSVVENQQSVWVPATASSVAVSAHTPVSLKHFIPSIRNHMYTYVCLCLVLGLFLKSLFQVVVGVM